MQGLGHWCQWKLWVRCLFSHPTSLSAARWHEAALLYQWRQHFEKKWLFCDTFLGTQIHDTHVHTISHGQHAQPGSCFPFLQCFPENHLSSFGAGMSFSVCFLCTAVCFFSHFPPESACLVVGAGGGQDSQGTLFGNYFPDEHDSFPFLESWVIIKLTVCGWGSGWSRGLCLWLCDELESCFQVLVSE